MVKRSVRRKQRLGKKRLGKTKRRGKTKKNKTKNYSRKRFYKRSKRLMSGGWGGGGNVKPKYGGNHNHGQYGGDPHVGGWQ